jgi:membrane protease YdiL (CAAX protease family)
VKLESLDTRIWLAISLSLIALAEMLIFTGNLKGAMMIHALNIILLVIITIYVDKRIFPILLLLPLFRLLNAAMPVFFNLTLYSYSLVYAPMFLPIFFIMKEKLLSREEAGMTLKNFWLFLPLAIAIGMALGWGEYNVLRPGVILAAVNVENVLILSLIMIVFVGIVEEFVFRSALQTVLGEMIGSVAGLVLASILFGLMHSGYRLPQELVYVIFAGLVFGLLFWMTRSLPIVAIAHGITNVSLFLVVPFYQWMLIYLISGPAALFLLFAVALKKMPIRLMPLEKVNGKQTSFGFFTVAMVAAAHLRRMRLPAEERFSVKFREHLGDLKAGFIAGGKSRLNRALTVLLAISIILSVFTLTYVITTPKQGEKFTEFYILGPEGIPSESQKSEPTVVEPQESFSGGSMGSGSSILAPKKEGNAISKEVPAGSVAPSEEEDAMDENLHPAYSGKGEAVFEGVKGVEEPSEPVESQEKGALTGEAKEGAVAGEGPAPTKVANGGSEAGLGSERSVEEKKPIALGSQEPSEPVKPHEKAEEESVSPVEAVSKEAPAGSVAPSEEEKAMEESVPPAYSGKGEGVFEDAKDADEASEPVESQEKGALAGEAKEGAVAGEEPAPSEGVGDSSEAGTSPERSIEEKKPIALGSQEPRETVVLGGRGVRETVVLGSQGHSAL